MEAIFLAPNLPALLEKILFAAQPYLKKDECKSAADSTPILHDRNDLAHLIKMTQPILEEWTRRGWLTPGKMGDKILYHDFDLRVSLNRFNKSKFKRMRDAGL
jgi:hypothetical protein